jgi:hypothetical protein
MLGGYVVRDANGQALSYVYSRDNEAEARQAKVLTADEARRVGGNIALLLVSGDSYFAAKRVSAAGGLMSYGCSDADGFR